MKHSSDSCKHNGAGEPTAGMLSVGKPVAPDDCYIEREADRQVVDVLKGGGFCYMLAPHRVGKTSLSDRAQRRLAKEVSCTCVSTTLNGLGTNSSVDNFYYRLVHDACQQTDLGIDAASFWSEEAHASPADRWHKVLHNIVLASPKQRLFVFVDELNVMLRLPFSVEEFFGTIRRICDDGVKNPVSSRIAFCVLGVVAYDDVIRDHANTALNVATEIHLDDFTKKELYGFTNIVATFAEHPAAVLDATYDWTEGHPYMAQRILSAIQLSGHVAAGTEARRVKEMVHKYFLSSQPDQMIEKTYEHFDRANPVWGIPRTAEMLELQGKLLTGDGTPADRRSPAQASLRLTGLAANRIVGDQVLLRCRNRIYAEIFDADWVHQELVDRPISEALDAWRRSNLQDPARRSPQLLLNDAQLEEAMAWKKQTALTPDENDFLIRSQEASRERQEARRKRQRTRWITLNAMVVLCATVVVLLIYWRGEHTQRQLAEQRANEIEIKKNIIEEEFNRLVRYSSASALDAASAPDRYEAELTNRLASTPTHPADTDHPVRAMWNLIDLFEQSDITPRDSERLRIALYADKLPRLNSIVPHDGAVWNAVAVPVPGPIEYRVVTGDDQGHVYFWSPSEHASPQAATDSHGDAVTDVILSPDNRLVVTLGRDDTARVWEVSTGKLFGEPIKHDQLKRAAFSGDSKRLVTCGYDRTARVWDISNPKSPLAVIKHEHWVTGAALNHNGTRVATALSRPSNGSEHAAWVWPVPRSADDQAVPLPHDKRVTTVRFLPDGESVLTAGKDGMVKIWTLSDNTQANRGTAVLHQSLSLASGVRNVLVCPRSDDLLAVCDDDTMHVWHAEGGGQEDAIKVPTEIQRVRWSRDGTRAIVTARDHVVRVYDTSTQAEVTRLYHPTDVSDAAFAGPGDKHVVTGCSDRAARWWNLLDPLATQQIPTDGVRSLAFDRTGARFAFADKSGAVHLFALDQASGIWTIQSIALRDGPETTHVAFGGHEQDLLITAGEDNVIRSWKLPGGTPWLGPIRPEGKIKALAVSPDGSQLVIATGEAVELWTLDNQHVATLDRGTNDGYTASAFNRDGSMIAVARADGAVGLYDAEQAQQLGNGAPSLGPAVTALAFGWHAGREALISAHEDGYFTVWGVGRLGFVRIKATATEDDRIVGMAPCAKGCIFAATGQGKVTIWDIYSLRHIGDLPQIGAFGCFGVSPGATWILQGGGEAVHVTKMPRPVQGTPEQLREWAICQTGVTVNKLGEPVAATADQWLTSCASMTDGQ